MTSVVSKSESAAGVGLKANEIDVLEASDVVSNISGMPDALESLDVFETSDEMLKRSFILAILASTASWILAISEITLEAISETFALGTPDVLVVLKRFSNASFAAFLDAAVSSATTSEVILVTLALGTAEVFAVSDVFSNDSFTAALFSRSTFSSAISAAPACSAACISAAVTLISAAFPLAWKSKRPELLDEASELLSAKLGAEEIW